MFIYKWNWLTYWLTDCSSIVLSDLSIPRKKKKKKKKIFQILNNNKVNERNNKKRKVSYIFYLNEKKINEFARKIMNATVIKKKRKVFVFEKFINIYLLLSAVFIAARVSHVRVPNLISSFFFFIQLFNFRLFFNRLGNL